MGYDLYCINIHDFYEFLKLSKNNKLKLFQISHKDELVYFYIPLYQRYIMKRIDLPLLFIESKGFLSYFFLLVNKRYSIVFLLSFFISFVFYTTLLLDVHIIGTNPHINDSLKKDLKKFDIDVFKRKLSYENLNDIFNNIKQDYEDDIEYLNLYQKGAIFYVEYISQKKKLIYYDVYTNLYASKDGLISSIDVDSGVVKVKINDYVKKGDLLVENYIVSTQNQIAVIPVKAKIYAYTFHQYTAKKKTKQRYNAEAFYELLLSIRSNINNGAIIDVEKVLQIDSSHSTITLKMHYTLIEDIAIEGELNEENH